VLDRYKSSTVVKLYSDFCFTSLTGPQFQYKCLDLKSLHIDLHNGDSTRIVMQVDFGAVFSFYDYFRANQKAIHHYLIVSGPFFMSFLSNQIKADSYWEG
jgi:hypothetical protein